MIQPRNRFPKLTSLLAGVVLAAASGCSDNEITPTPPTPLDPLRIAYLQPAPEGMTPLPAVNLEWAIEEVNAAGGVAGRRLVLDYVHAGSTIDEITAAAANVASDDTHVATIAPPGSQPLFKIADMFSDANKPIVAATSTSDDILRAYGGDGAIWRTRESDIAQTELLVRYAKSGNAKKITLLSSLELSGYTFFSWFGFFAGEIGFADADVNIVALPSKEPCNAKVMEALATQPEILFVAPNAPEDIACLVMHLPPPGMPRPKIILADTGLDANALTTMGPAAHGIEGFTGAGDETYEAAFRAYLADDPLAPLAPHGPSEYDAILLLAYGLEVSGGIGGKPLIKAMKTAVDGTEENAHGWDAAGIEGTLTALRAGKKPVLHGATGPLVFEPNLYMDLAAFTYAHYTIKSEGIVYDERFSTGDPSFLTSQGAFVKPGIEPQNVDQSVWTPAAAKTDTWAVLGALSSGWDNYRHQSDVLQQYELLRANGVADDHIVLILADDIATSPSNKLSGQVRNEPAGTDVYESLQIDYGISVTAADIQNILTGQVTATTPHVIQPTASSNVYIYFAGHGGTSGIPLDAQTPEEGLSGQGAIFSPTNLRESLCTLQTNGRYRRALVVIESCYSGAFGAAELGGLEYGCGVNAGATPLEGVALITAANGKEVSYAGAYDKEVPAWVNDAFSRQFVTNIQVSLDRSLADVYADAYRATAGSHPSIFNLEHAGRLTTVSVGEFFTP